MHKCKVSDSLYTRIRLDVGSKRNNNTLDCTRQAWHIGEDVVAVVCVIVIGYFYIMVYRAVRKRKINDISQVAHLVKLESRVTMTTGYNRCPGLVRFVRRKDPFGSLEYVQQLQNAEQYISFERPASRDQVVSSCCNHRRSP